MNPHPSNTAPRSAPFGGFPTSSFFYSNLRIQEALTTIRYCIEARRGLVVLSGDAGIGKSTLLQKVSAEFAPNVVCIMASDPRLNFTDILRLILRNLNAASADEDEAATLRSCKFHLRARMQRRQIVALIFDNAQHLADSTLRQLAENFLAAGPADRDGYLLQMVLAGRPQLKEQLPQAARLPVQLNLPIMCELHPLVDIEIASYIEQKLRASALPMELFEPRAVEQIARYSHGNPRWINAICDRALQVCGGSDGGTVTIELIEGVAKDLDLRLAELGGRSARETFADPAETFDLPQFQLGEKDTTEVVGETFLQYNHAYDRNEWLRPRQRKTGLLRTLVILILVVGAGAWVQTGPGSNPLANWREQLLGILQARHQSGAEIKTAAIAQPVPNLGAASAEPNPAVAQSETIVEPPRAATAETFPASKAAPPPKSAAKPTQARRLANQDDLPQRRDDLEADVIQAIANRAIMGVAVSVVHGTAFLDGHVATERQRRAAERAARSVNGIERVRNRITVNFS